MGYYLPTGTTVDIASTVAASVNMTAISNAAEAVATATNTYANGDLLVVTSGWNALNGRVVRAKAVSGTSATLEGIDTTSTTRYPASGGAGTLSKITAWTRIPQVLNIETSGGDQQFAEFQFMEEDFQRREPTFKSAVGYKIDIADDTSLPTWLPIVRAANDNRTATPLRLTLPKGGVILANGIWSLLESPRLSAGQPAALSLNVSLTAPITRYYT